MSDLYYVSGVVEVPHTEGCQCLNCLLWDEPVMDEQAVQQIVVATDHAAAADMVLSNYPGGRWFPGDPHTDEMSQAHYMASLPAEVAPTLPGFEAVRDAG